MLVSCDILSSFDNFESMQRYCMEQQQVFAEKGTNEIDQYVVNFLSSHGVAPDIFSEFKAGDPSFHLPGAAGRANVSRLHLDPLRRIKAKTTDDIIRNNNQQTYLYKLQRQRKKVNSLPYRHI